MRHLVPPFLLLALALGCSPSPQGATEPEVEPPPLPRSGAAHGVDHARIDVPISGSPLAIAHLVQGGLRADHGSHFGFKSIVDASASDTLSSSPLLPLVWGSALNIVTRRGQIVDRSRIEILADGAPVALTGRRVRFDPWGISEKAELEGEVEVEATVCNAGTDVSALHLRVRNAAEGAQILSARLRFDCDPLPGRERLDDPEAVGCPVYTPNQRESAVVSIRASGTAKLHRVIRAGYTEGDAAGNDVLDLQVEQDDDGSVTVRTDGRRLFPGADGSFTFLVATGSGEPEADRALKELEPQPAGLHLREVCEGEQRRFEARIAALPPVKGERDNRLLRLAFDALEHARYEARGSMGGRVGIVGAKPVQIRFDGNQAARIAAAFALIDAQDPIEIVGLLAAAAQKHDGRLPVHFDENLQSADSEALSAHPILAWALTEVVDLHPGVYTISQIEPPMRGALRVMAHLEDRRSRGASFFSQGPREGGWVDSPRFEPVAGAGAATVDDVERTAWMGRAYRDLGRLADALELETDKEALDRRAAEIADELERGFRRPEDGLYVDRLVGGADAVFSSVRTPASLAPSALGMSSPAGDAATAAFILEGGGLWGTWQGSSRYMMAIPSMAYDDPGLNVYEDGHRMRGQVWPWQVYMAWRALVFAGRVDEAERLRDRFLEMLDRHASEGLYECYDFFDGAPGFGPQGKIAEGLWAPPIIQHAETAAAVVRILYRR